MLHFFDRCNLPISEAKHRELIRTKAYCLVASTSVYDIVEVEVSWVGIVASCETQPLLFVVHVYDLVKDERGFVGRSDKRPDEYWYEYECDAQAKHDHLVKLFSMSDKDKHDKPKRKK